LCFGCTYSFASLIKLSLACSTSYSPFHPSNSLSHPTAGKRASGWLGVPLPPGVSPPQRPNNERLGFSQIRSYPDPTCPAAAKSLMFLLLPLHKRQQRRKQQLDFCFWQQHQVKVTLIITLGYVCTSDCRRAYRHTSSH